MFAPAVKLLDLLLRPAPTGSVGPLELLVLQPTPFCNLDCSYCYLPERTSTKRMSLEVIRAAFERVFESGLVDREFTVVWHAGEPLVVGIPYYEAAFAAIEELRPRGIRITHSFQTNATLLTDEWCELIKRRDLKIGVSVDGPEFLHDQYRKTRQGAGTHARVMAGVERLKKHGIPFHAIAVLTARSLHHPDEMFRFFEANGISRVGFNVEEKEGIHASSSLEGEGTAARLDRFMSRIMELNDLSARGNPSARALGVREVIRFEQAVLGWQPSTSKFLRYAGVQESSPYKLLNVGWDGGFSTFSPELLGMDVPTHGKFVFGNVLTDSLAEALATPRFKEISAGIQRGIRRCEQSCEYFGFCGGGSPANKIFENGSFDSTETMHCRLHVKTMSESVMRHMEKSAAAAPRETA